MNEAQLRAAADQLDKLQRARHRLRDAEQKLALVNKWVKGDQQWSVCLRLKQGDRWSRDVEIYVNIPKQVVQQSLVDEVRRHRREIVQAGGLP